MGELAGMAVVVGMAKEFLERDDPQGGLVGGGDDDGGGGLGFESFEPPSGAKAPAVPGLEAMEVELGPWGDEVVAASEGEGEESFGDDGADDVAAEVVGAGLAASVPEEAGARDHAAGFEGAAEDVPGSAGTGTVEGGHGRRGEGQGGGLGLVAPDPAASFLSFGLEPGALLGEAFAELVHHGEVLLGLCGLDVVADLDFDLGDLGLVEGFEVGELGLLGRGQDLRWRLLLEAFHGEFVGGFHDVRCDLGHDGA